MAEPNKDRKQILHKINSIQDVDGLNSVKYELVALTKTSLYTNVTVKIHLQRPQDYNLRMSGNWKEPSTKRQKRKIKYSNRKKKRRHRY